jgi:hypothetical protein
VLWAGDDPPPTLAKTAATLAVFTAASTQVAALLARGRAHDSRTLRQLFAASTALVLGLAAMATVAAWAEIGAQGFYRLLAAGVVLDVLLVVLQPIFALGRQAPDVYRLRLLLEVGDEVETTVAASDFGEAAAKAIHATEHNGTRVRGLSRV